jgi:acyl-CoA reductase-like NAD-dependent aldehyde dehydrogenase
MNWLVSYNPATQEVVGQVPVTSNEVLEEQVAAAKTAQISWAALSIEQRAKQLVTAFEGLEKSRDTHISLKD